MSAYMNMCIPKDGALLLSDAQLDRVIEYLRQEPNLDRRISGFNRFFLLCSLCQLLEIDFVTPEVGCFLNNFSEGWANGIRFCRFTRDPQYQYCQEELEFIRNRLKESEPSYISLYADWNPNRREYFETLVQNISFRYSDKEYVNIVDNYFKSNNLIYEVTTAVVRDIELLCRMTYCNSGQLHIHDYKDKSDWLKLFIQFRMRHVRHQFEHPQPCKRGSTLGSHDQSDPSAPLVEEGSAYSKDICSICLDLLKVSDQALIQTPCKHLFCKICLMKWFKQSSSCPNCRAPFKDFVMDGMIMEATDQLRGLTTRGTPITCLRPSRPFPEYFEIPLLGTVACILCLDDLDINEPYGSWCSDQRHRVHQKCFDNFKNETKSCIWCYMKQRKPDIMSLWELWHF